MGEYRLLGSVEIWAGERLLDAGQPRQRAVLAALLVDAGQVVAFDVLVSRVWGEAPPRDVRGSLRVQVAGIRRVLEQAGAADDGSARLVHRPGGYVLDVDRDRVDLHRFRRLLGQARDAVNTDEQRVAVLREAVALWRGEPLTGIAGEWAGRMRDSWGRERLDAVVAWANAELRVGSPGAVIGPVGDLVGEYSLVESLCAVLMRALYAAGRPSEALDQYAAARRRLADELGTDPGPELQMVYQAILRGELDVVASATAARAASAPAVVPAQLPADVAGFVGRADHLARLDALLAEAAGHPATAVVISALSGTAGVGKTALAVHWAHRVADRFPDGQLYVNLRGFDPGGPAMAPAEAVRGFLDALGVPAERVPPSLDAQAGLYRSLIAGRRILVVLDNARDAEHVRPLLPGAPTAMAVVTSRNRLTGLVAVDAAQPLLLDTLSTLEARELLVRRLGEDRLAAEPDAVEDIVAACAGLPLALAIVAARAQQTEFPLAGLAAELAKVGERLDALDAGDTTTQVRAVFSWSYATLTPSAARLFRLLGLHPGPDVTVAAAASMAGHDPPETRRLMTELARANLLTERVPGRYAFHDLLRAYATELIDTEDPDDQRRAALIRLHDHYVHTAHATERLLNPARDPIPLPLDAPAPGTHPEQAGDYEGAMAWLTIEHPVLLAVLRHAADMRHDTHVFQLAWALHIFLYRRNHWHDRVAAWEAALPATERTGDLATQAHAHRSLAHAYTMVERHSDAHAHSEHALDLCTRSGDRAGQAQGHHHLAHLLGRMGRLEEALVHARRALELFRAVGHRSAEADSLNAVGWYHGLLGDHGQALTYCEQAVTLFQEIGDRFGEANTWDSLGHAHCHLGQHARAVDCYRHSLRLFRDLGDRYHEADSLAKLGDTHEAAGDPATARAAWQQALDILVDLDHPDGDSVRAKLHDLDRS